MACADGKHDLRVVLGDGPGGPPQTQEEPAWCRTCGALWAKLPFFGGWGFLHHLNDSEAPTLLNMMRQRQKKEPDE